jgi:hydrogenase maturation protease
MTHRHEVLVLGIGNMLWADEGFGVRAVEALHAAYAFPDSVALHDGGTQGLYLYDIVASSRRVLVFDAIDFALPPGSLEVRRDADVPAFGASKMSPHQTGFHDILALAKLTGEAPQAITLIGVQPQELADLGGSLTDVVRARIDDAVALAQRELARWGFPGRPRTDESIGEPLNAHALSLADYEGGRPSADEACRDGDPRVLARRISGGG